MTEQITTSGVFRDCPECSDSRSAAKKTDEFPPVCVLCLDTGRAEICGICDLCEEPTYDYGETTWCLTCDAKVVATDCKVGSAT